MTSQLLFLYHPPSSKEEAGNDHSVFPVVVVTVRNAELALLVLEQISFQMQYIIRLHVPSSERGKHHLKRQKTKKTPSDLGGNKSPIPGVKPYVYD